MCAAGLLISSEPELWIYDPSLIGADGPAGTRLVWRMDVRNELGDVDRLVLVDAHTGAVALHFSQREDALNREVCDNNNNPDDVPAVHITGSCRRGADRRGGAC